MNIKILIADDHSIVRSGLKSLLSARKDLDIVGEADNGLSAVRMANKLKPDMVLMDIGMPDMNGIDAIHEMHRENDHIKILVLSMHTDDITVAKALKAGARGYLIKNCDPKELNEAIDALRSGNIYLSKDISQSLIKTYIDKLADDGSDACILTLKEREILQMIAEGNSTKEIAGMLNLSVKTIEAHRSNLMKKLNLRSIADLTKYAIREGLTQIN